MNKLDSILLELFNILKTVEGTLKREKKAQFLQFSLLECLRKRIRKIKVLSLKQTNKPTKGIKKDKETCHNYGKEGHQRRNCKEYLVIVKVKKLNKDSTIGMFIMENYLTTLYYSSWILDTKYGFHICNYIHELRKNKRLFEGKVYL